LPGTLYLVQTGTLYQLRAGTFSTLLPAGDWGQPSVAGGADGLLVVKRQTAYSDVYLVGFDGHVQSQLTQDQNQNLESNHWAFYPRLSPDGKKVFLSYDSPKFGYEVDLSVWSMPLGGSIGAGAPWTSPNSYTGGDVEPIPLPSGELLFTRYSIVNNRVLAQLWVTDAPGGQGRALTAPEDDCSQPALSPDGTRLAMVCSGDRQSSTLMVAPFANDAIGTPVSLVSGRQLAQPAWAPGGSGLVYLAPAAGAGLFQLWWLATPAAPGASPTPDPKAGEAVRSGTPSPSPASTPRSSRSPRPSATPAPPPAPVQLTVSLDFDATSTIAWR
jgi:Tol biopolymer transport system component